MEHREFVDNRSFTRAVKSQTKALSIRNGAQYQIFSPVTEPQLANIQELRDTRCKQLHFFYLNQPQTLIVKLMPGPTHERATSQFGRRFWKKTASIGPDLDEDLIDMRGTRYKGIPAVKEASTIKEASTGNKELTIGSKEADSAFRPDSTRPDPEDWPTLAIESGVSEKLPKLRRDANWWLSCSSGKVYIVLIFSISEKNRTVLIEQWEICSTENLTTTRSRPKDFVEIPMCRTSFTIAWADTFEPSTITTVDPDQPSAATTTDTDEPVAAVAAGTVNRRKPATAATINPSERAAVATINPSDPAAAASADFSKPIAAEKAITLNFEKVFDRKPIEGSTERDIVFTTADLKKWVGGLWKSK